MNTIITKILTHSHYGLLLAIFGAVLITPDTLFMRLSEMNVWVMMAWRGCEMGLILLLFWAITLIKSTQKQIRAELKELTSRTAIGIIICVILGGASFTYAIAETSVSIVLFAIASSPLFSTIFSAILLKERTSHLTYITMFITLCGIGLTVFSAGDVSLAPDGSVIIGALCGLLTAALLGLSFVLFRSNSAIPLLPINGLGALITGIFGLIIASNLYGWTALFEGSIVSISVSGLFILPLSFLALTAATRYTSAANVSLLLLLETVFGPLWVWLGVGERPGSLMILGGGIVVLSIFFYIISIMRQPAQAQKTTIS